MTRAGNLFTDLPARGADEQFAPIVETPALRIERIVSHAHASPPGFWYEQDLREWVLVLSGSAGLRFADEADARTLTPGDWIDIPARARHRVDWTDARQPTVWLAVHYR